MPDVIPWPSIANSRDAVQRLAALLSEGRLVVFPTETSYVVAGSGLVARAVEQLGSAEQPPTLALRSAAEASDWVPGISPLGRRLARRCWPGPVELVFGDGTTGGLLDRLPQAVRQRLSPAGSLALRSPAHDALLRVMSLLPGPLALAPAPPNGGREAAGAALVIDDGPTYFGRPETVVRVNGNAWEVVREGVVTRADLERKTASLVVFVCTGNTCRSPLAEALLKRRLAEQLGCDAAELPGRGFLVFSAGVAASGGEPAAPEAVEAARELGADLSGHASRPLSSDLARQADHLVVMTRSHLRALAAHDPQAAARARLLAGPGQDIADPLGGDQQVYRDCAQQIWGHLDGLVAELVS